MTKYIVNNLAEQTISGHLTITGKTSITTDVPISLTGSVADKAGQLAIDENYLYYCYKDYVASTPTVISGGGTTHIFNPDPNTVWDNYGPTYLQTGQPQEEGLTPLAGWYIVDDNGTIRQVLSDTAWFTGGSPTPITNGPGWFFVLDGPFTYNASNPTITFYESLPTVTIGNPGSGDIWKTVRLEKAKNNIATYKALLSQTGTMVGTDIGAFNGALIVGEEYTITNYFEGDDFSNIAEVISGTINQTGCQFRAIGDTPASWNSGSELTSNGDIVVNVIENTLGYDLYWEYAFWGPGIYVAYNNSIGPKYNQFRRDLTSAISQITAPSGPYPIQIYTGATSYSAKDDTIGLFTWNYLDGTPVTNSLYYTPIEINIIQDLDTTPIVINGTITPSFPFSNASVDLIYNGNNFESFIGDSTQVNNLTELITELNTNTETSYLGVFSENVLGEIILTMPTNLKNRFAPNGELTFEIYAD